MNGHPSHINHFDGCYVNPFIACHRSAQQPAQTVHVVPSQFPSHDAQAQQALAAAINRLCDLLERGAGE